MEIKEVPLYPANRATGSKQPPRARLTRKPILRTFTKKSSGKRRIKPKKWKFKKTELAECDSAFSKEIIARDGHCMFPGCQATANLTNSHYIGRANWNTRFDPENCLTICIRHHFMDRDTAYEFQKARKDKQGWDGQYTLRMKVILGETGFNALLDRAAGSKSRKDAILETQKKYGLRQPVENSPENPAT